MKKFLFSGAAALLALGAASCSNNDDLLDDPYGAVESDQSFYAHINITNVNSMTRSAMTGEDYEYTFNPDEDPNFHEGEDFENTVNSIYLVFYDSEGQRVSTTQVQKSNLNGAPNGLPGRDDSENSIYKGIVQIDVKHGSNKPAYVMCFINPITSTNFEINPDFASLEALEKVTRPSIIDSRNNFAMSKSVYYGYDPVTDKDNQRIMATPIQKGQLFTTYEEAEEVLNSDSNNKNASIIDIFVERYAVKVNFKIDDKALTQELKIGNYTLKFIPEYWAVNAYESETYITKSFFESIDPETGAIGNVMDFYTLNKTIGGSGDNAENAKLAWKWNNEDFHRCYWAQSPAYYAKSYPRVADDIIDKRVGNDLTGGYILGYYSYNDMVKNATGERTSKSRKIENLGQFTTIYARENTVDGASLQAAATDPLASPKAAIGSAILVGHYELSGPDVTDNEFFYVMGNAVNGYTLFKNNDEMLDYFVRTTIKFGTNRAGEAFFDYDNISFLDPDYKKYFKIDHPDQAARNGLVIDSRFVTIQIDEEAIDEDTPLYAFYDGKYNQVTKANIDRVNKEMLYAAGTVQGFDGGKAYYTIPIKHLGFYRTGNDNSEKNANDKTFDWTKVLSGDFGLVRNHVYSIVVDQIKGLGNGIPDPEDPIVPPTDPEEYFIGARIIVLNWAVVPTQHETL